MEVYSPGSGGTCNLDLNENFLSIITDSTIDDGGGTNGEG